MASESDSVTCYVGARVFLGVLGGGGCVLDSVVIIGSPSGREQLIGMSEYGRAVSHSH